MLLIFFFGVYLTQIVLDYRLTADVSDDDDDYEYHQTLVKYFGNLSRSMRTLFSAISGGLDWDGISSPLSELIHPAIGLGFAMYVGFSILALLNIITGVFVEAYQESSRCDRQGYMMDQAFTLFSEADLSKD